MLCLIFLNEESSSNSSLSSSSSKTKKEDTVYMRSAEWYSLGYLSFMGWDSFMSIKLGDRNGITLTLMGELENYEIWSVKVWAKSKKSGTEGLYYEKQWPVNSQGRCERQLFISTGFAGGYGFTAHISSISGNVKPGISLIKDKEGYLWRKIEENDGSINYSFSGKYDSVESETLRLPEKADDIVPTKIGYSIYDMFGLENVKRLIIPANYTNIVMQRFWKNVSFEEFYYEGNEADLTADSYIQKSYIRMYREEEPNPEIDSDEYLYWHYVDGSPQIW